MEIYINMLAVGNADAIIVWLKDVDKSLVAVIDGGNGSNGQDVINFLDKNILPYTGKKAPDLIVSTHPDRDHIGGLIGVIKNYKSDIKDVWVHDFKKHFGNENYNCLLEGFEQEISVKKNPMLTIGAEIILESLRNSENFISLVDDYKINRIEPFAGLIYPGFPISVIGPSSDYYEELLPDFRNAGKYLDKEYVVENALLYKGYLVQGSYSEDPCSFIDQCNIVSPENNSSVILQIEIDENRFLFTGDAGVDALERADQFKSIENIKWLDVPHHGSRRNLNSELIRLMKPESAFISAEGKDPHPRKELLRCLMLNGAKVSCTAGGNRCIHTKHFFD